MMCADEVSQKEQSVEMEQTFRRIDGDDDEDEGHQIYPTPSHFPNVLIADISSVNRI